MQCVDARLAIQGPNYYNSEKRSVPIFHEVVRPAAIVEGGPGYVTRMHLSFRGQCSSGAAAAGGVSAEPQ